MFEIIKIYLMLPIFGIKKKVKERITLLCCYITSLYPYFIFRCIRCVTFVRCV